VLVLNAVEKDAKGLVKDAWSSRRILPSLPAEVSRNVVILKKGVPLAGKTPFQLLLSGAAGVIRELREETLLR